MRPCANWRSIGMRRRSSLDFIYKGTVRTAMVLERQTPDALDRIHRAIREDAKCFARGGGYRFAWPKVLAAARKPNPPRS